MTSWCDKLASTPAIGLRITPFFHPSEHILAALSPLLNLEFDDEKPTFNVEALEAFKVVINTNAGYLYSIDQTSLTVAFNHRMKAKPTSGGPPTMELISNPAPYTDLLQQVSDRLMRLVSLLEPLLRNRQLHRVGIVSSTVVLDEDAPPGVRSIFEEIGRPFGGTTESFNIALTNTIKSDDNIQERCIHNLTKPENSEQMLNINLDWQGHYVKPKNITEPILKGLLAESTSSAISYFDKFAEGGLSDGSS